MARKLLCIVSINVSNHFSGYKYTLGFVCLWLQIALRGYIVATNMATFKNELTAYKANSHGYMVATIVFF